MNERAPEEPSEPRRLVLWTIAAGTIARLVLAVSLGLGVDESYTVAVARPFSLSYYDHPPLVFWIGGTMARVAGHHALVLRLPFILLFAGTTWILFRLGSRLFGAWAGAYGAVALNVAPFFGLSAASWVLPDGPLTFFLAASAYCLTRALFDPEPGDRLGWWAAAGAAGGLAGLSKYLAVLTGVGVLGFLATSGPDRAWLRNRGPYLALGIALLVSSPVLIWNAAHDWASVRFQLGHIGADGLAGFHPTTFFSSLGGQAFYFLPWVWLALIGVLVAGLGTGPADRPRWLLSWLAALPIATLAWITLRGNPGLPHWAACGYLFLFPLLGAALAAQRRAAPVLLRFELVGSAVACVIAVTVLSVQAATGAVSKAAPALFRAGDPTLELVDWDEVRPVLRAQGLGTNPRLFAAAGDWVVAGKLAYALGPGVSVVCLGRDPHQFGLLHDPATFRGEDALLVVRTGTVTAARLAFAPLFQGIDSATTVTIHRGREKALDLTVLVARGFAPSGAQGRGTAPSD